MCGISRCLLDNIIIARVCLRLATIKDHSNMFSFTVLGGGGVSKNQLVSGVTTIYLTQCNTSPLHRVDQVVDCGLWTFGLRLDVLPNSLKRLWRWLMLEK